MPVYRGHGPPGTIAGTYVGHGETYKSDDQILWWSKGGVLKGQIPARLAFLFPGQGAQYIGMAQALYETEAVFRNALDRCASVLDPLLARPLLTVIHPAPGTESPLDETAFTQPALFAVEYALAQLWRAQSGRTVIGHCGQRVACLRCSARRRAALTPSAAGHADAASRGRWPRSLREDAESGYALPIVWPWRRSMVPQTVISGISTVDAVSAALGARGVRCQRLAVSHAFHSQLVEPVLEAFERAAGTARLEQPSMRLVSNVTGSVAGSEVTTPEYWRRHMRDTVRFADGLKTLAASVADVWVEVGPHATLLPLAEEATAQGSTVLVPTLRRGRDDLHQLAEALGTLFLAGVPVDWRAVWSSQPAVLLDLPPYPFQRERCWFPQRASGAASAGRATGHPCSAPAYGRRSVTWCSTRWRSMRRPCRSFAIIRWEAVPSCQPQDSSRWHWLLAARWVTR
jgi:acyl transferase domain-containing protein